MTDPDRKRGAMFRLITPWIVDGQLGWRAWWSGPLPGGRWARGSFSSLYLQPALEVLRAAKRIHKGEDGPR